MERDPIASHKSYTNHLLYITLHVTRSIHTHSSNPPPSLRKAKSARQRRIIDTSWFAVPGGVVQSRDRIEKAGQPGPGRQADEYMKRKGLSKKKG